MGCLNTHFSDCLAAIQKLLLNCVTNVGSLCMDFAAVEKQNKQSKQKALQKLRENFHFHAWKDKKLKEFPSTFFSSIDLLWCHKRKQDKGEKGISLKEINARKNVFIQILIINLF